MPGAEWDSRMPERGAHHEREETVSQEMGGAAELGPRATGKGGSLSVQKTDKH